MSTPAHTGERASVLASPDGLWAPERRGLVTGLVLTTTFVAVEALAVITIMPQVAHQLGGLSLYGWVFSAFMLGSLVGTVAAGRDADRVGPARAYLAGVLLFAAGLAVAGLAPSMSVLVVGRCLQGVGAGSAPAIAYVVIGRSMPEATRPRMMAVLSTAWVAPGLLGPVLSAEVARAFGWRVVFLGLIPLVALAGTLALPALLAIGRPSSQAASAPDPVGRGELAVDLAAGHQPAERNAHAERPQPSEHGAVPEHGLVDALRTALGGALVLAALAANTLALAAPLAAVGAVVGVPALRRLLPAGTLGARRGLPATILSRGLLTFAFFGADAYVTLALTTVLHHRTTTAGLLITLSTLTWTLGAWLQARLSHRREDRAFIRAGLVLILGGIAGMAISLRPDVPLAAAFAAWSAAGLGMGLAYAPTSLLMLREASSERTGWASASLTLADVLGTALGTGVGGGALVLASNQGWSISTGVTVAFALAAVGALVGLAVSARLPLQGLRRKVRREPLSEPARLA
jgi:MFS family permease